MFGIGLEIEEGGGDGGPGGEGEKNDEEAAPIGEKEAANEAAEHWVVATGILGAR